MKMMNKSQFDPERVEALKDILLRLHNGATPESVQEDFDKHFTNVSAVEISLMEHELMNSDTGISFEDVMELCNVHANLFGGAVDDENVPESTQPGHPVRVFKDENMAFQSAMIRINRIFDTLEKDKNLMKEEGILGGLRNQLSLLGEFHTHYNRKEKLFFPIMEHHKHYAPPKVMWGVDDQIRDLYKEAKGKVDQLPDIDFKVVRNAYEAFEHEFKEMIFKEETILLPMIMSFFTEDDWLAIAKESDAIGYAIIEPEEKWVPHRESFTNEAEEVEATEETETPTSDIEHLVSEVKRLSEKVAELSAQSKQVQEPSPTTHLSFGGGYLTLTEVNHVLNHLPVEITFVDKNDIFKYFSHKTNESEMMLVRTPSMVGRNVENCHPPKSLDKVMTLIGDLKERRRASESMWFKKKDQYVHITYKGVFDENEEYIGILEYVQDIQPFLDLPSEVKKELSILEEVE